MKKLAIATALLAGLLLTGCSIFYDVKYEDANEEIEEFGMFGSPNHQLSPTHGPYGLLPFMRDVRIKGDVPDSEPQPAPLVIAPSTNQ